eukprot:scpid20564/ scgid19118/ 
MHEDLQLEARDLIRAIVLGEHQWMVHAELCAAYACRPSKSVDSQHVPYFRSTDSASVTSNHTVLPANLAHTLQTQSTLSVQMRTKTDGINTCKGLCRVRVCVQGPGRDVQPCESLSHLHRAPRTSVA